MKEIEEQQRQDREAINRSLRRAGSRNCENDRGNALISFVVEFGSWDDQPEGRYVGDTKLRSYEVIAYFPLHRILGAEEPNRFTRAVEIGAGIGAFRLHGGTIRERDWWRGSIAIRSRIIPAELFPGIENVPRRWRKALQSVQYRIGGDWLPGQFDRTAFNDQDFEGSTDFVATRGVQIDLGTLACAFLPCR
ncbi:MAG: hypothetical protein ACRD15_08745 [Vicinamibacterales bacterium]